MEKIGNHFGLKFCFYVLIITSSVFASTVKIHIRYDGGSLSTLRTVTHAFNSVGYKLDIESFVYENGVGEIEAQGIGNKLFNLSALAENLKEQGIILEDVSGDGAQMRANLHTQNTIWNIPLLGSDEGFEIKKVSTPQWFRVEEGQTIRIEPPYTGKWYPDIAVLDENMGILAAYRSLEFEEEFKFELPPGSRYLKVSNAQGMKVLKEGMWIESMSQGR